jgi:hypothetical protein
MIISEEHRFLFIHLIKTAGTSVTVALKPFGKTHKEIGQGYGCHDSAPVLVDRLGKETFKSYFSFAFVRNPWDRQVSEFLYVLKSPKHHRYAQYTAYKGFEEYLEWRCSEEIKSQRDALFSGEEQLVDYIGRYETLEADYKVICDRIGIDAPLPVLNVSKTKPYQTYYTKAMVDMVALRVEADIQQFGYRFE